MNKKVIRLLLIAVLLCVVIGVLLAVLNLSKEEEKEPEQQSVSQTVVKDIEGITYSCESTGGEEVSLVREKNIWYYEKDKEFPLDQDYVTNVMAKSASEATANTVIENPTDDLASYGLDVPVLTIKLKKITGDVVTMHIGSYNESVEGYYLQVEGDSKMYMVNGELVFGFDRSVYDIADKEDFPLVETGSFTHIKIEKPGSVVEFKGEVEEGAQEYVSNNSYIEKVKTWKISDNGAVYRAGNQTKANELITQMSTFDYDTMILYHAKEEDFKKYGFDDPKITITVDYEVLDETTAKEVEGDKGINEIVCDTIQKQYVLEIGDRLQENGYDDPAYYVSLADSDVIYTMTEDMLDMIINMNTQDYK